MRLEFLLLVLVFELLDVLFEGLAFKVLLARFDETWVCLVNRTLPSPLFLPKLFLALKTVYSALA